MKKKLERKSKRKLELPNSPAVKRKRVEVDDVSSGAKPLKVAKQDILGFLKSRPQVQGMQKAAAKDRKRSQDKRARTLAGEEAADFLDDDRFEGVRSAWQRHETVDAFLKRAPLMDPATSSLGPWLWVGNPKPLRSQSKHEAKTDVSTFTQRGRQLLEALCAQRAKLERSLPNAAPATITRKMGPYRDQLEDDMLSLAVKTSTTCGKWMLFPSPEEYPRCWRLVAEATAAGKLGVTSKAATPDPFEPLNLICVYTYDFTDMNDVERVLNGLVELDICRMGGKPIYYKCDAYTYLDIMSDNPYKLRASLYSSKDILEKEAIAKKDGRIARLIKKNQAVDDFLDS